MSFTSDQYRMLGTSGIELSPVGLGTVKLGRNTDVKYPHAFELPDDSAVRTLLESARALGINFLDTAPAYGNAEERLGELLDDRHDWVIATKVGEYYEQGESRFDFSRNTTRASVDRSLQRLRTDYLDIVLVHSDGNDEAIIGQSDILDTLQRLKAAGKIRAIGVSSKTVEGGLLALEVADVAMITYNREDQSQVPVLDRATELDKGILVKKGLASGHSAAPGRSLEFILAQPAVTSVVVGTINPSHIEENVHAVEAFV